MRNLLLLAAVAAAFFGYRYVYSAPKLKIEGSRLEVKSGSQVLKFEINDKAVTGRYMLFGANGEAGNAGEAWFAGIPLAKARDLLSRYPDFHRCDSAGAGEAKASVISLTLMPADPAIRPRFVEAAGEVDRRFREKGNRLCLRFDGRAIRLVGVSIHGIEADTIEQPPAGHQYLLVDRFEAVDCTQEL